MIAYLSIIVPFVTAIVVALLARYESNKAKRQIGDVPPETNLYTLLSQQGAEIAELRIEIAQLKKGLDDCEQREIRLLKRLNLEPDNID